MAIPHAARAAIQAHAKPMGNHHGPRFAEFMTDLVESLIQADPAMRGCTQFDWHVQFARFAKDYQRGAAKERERIFAIQAMAEGESIEIRDLASRAVRTRGVTAEDVAARIVEIKRSKLECPSETAGATNIDWSRYGKD